MPARQETNGHTIRRKERLALALALLLMICGLVSGFSGWAIGLNLIQPAGPAGSPTITFTVQKNETTDEIANALVAQKIINNALAFKLWARYKGLDQKLVPGTYQLSASMTIPAIVDVFLNNSLILRSVTIPEGERIWQIAGHFADQSPNNKLSSDEFIQIAQTGAYTDATGKSVALGSEYWFLNHDQQDNAAPKFALEGYLFPATYQIDQYTTAADAIHKMLNAFGEQLCPGPNDQPDLYLSNEQQCEAHPALDQATNQSIFALLKKNYSDADGTSMADKLYHALTLASIVEREIGSKTPHDDRVGITSVYYNRYLVSKGELTPPDAGLSLLQADPTLQYALGTPDDPWPQLQQAGNTYNLGVYDTYQNPGLPPGPISSPGADSLTQSFNPKQTTYFYFIYGKDGQTHYASTYAEQQQNIARYGVG
jgi:UPF0755 protein